MKPALQPVRHRPPPPTLTLLAVLAAAAGLSIAPGTALADCVNGLPPPNPDDVYVDHADGTVTDIRTGLMWKRCAENQHWGDDTCLSTPRSPRMNWEDAHRRATESDFAGYHDWRLPNIVELHTLVERCTVAPAINQRIFHQVGGHDGRSTEYLSATPLASGRTDVWAVDFETGIVLWNSYRDRRMVRLVRDTIPDYKPAPATETTATATRR